MKSNGDDVKKVAKRTAREWIGWDGRSTVERLAYEPGQSLITERGELNCWRGWGVEPREGDLKPWFKLFDFLCQDIDAAHKKWFEQWLAYPIQYPGTKLYSGVLNWGDEQGTGKTFLGQIMGRIYGENYTTIDSDDLKSNYNASWACNRQFVQGEEIACGETYGKAIYDRIKRWITQTQMKVTQKYVPDYSIRDCINYYFTSNNPDAFYLADADRRFFVIEAKRKAMDKPVYDDLKDWLNTRNGAAALMHYLWHEVDLTGFDPTARPPDTASKSEMIANGRTHAESWVEAVKHAPEEMLRRREITKVGEMTNPAPTYKLYTIGELADFARSHQTDDKSYITDKVLGKALAKYKFTKVQCEKEGRVKLPSGFVAVWIMRDAERLFKIVDPAAIRAEYLKERGIKKEKK